MGVGGGPHGVGNGYRKIDRDDAFVIKTITPKPAEDENAARDRPFVLLFPHLAPGGLGKSCYAKKDACRFWKPDRFSLLKSERMTVFFDVDGNAIYANVAERNEVYLSALFCREKFGGQFESYSRDRKFDEGWFADRYRCCGINGRAAAFRRDRDLFAMNLVAADLVR